MIRTSGICLWPRTEGRARKRTLAYTRTRRRSRSRHQKQAPVTRSVNTEIVLFDHGPAEFPVATVRPREARAQLIALVSDLQHWLLARWQWLRPRTVPCAVAALGMLAVLAAANYLAHYQEDSYAAPDARVIHIDLANR